MAGPIPDLYSLMGRPNLGPVPAIQPLSRATAWGGSSAERVDF